MVPSAAWNADFRDEQTGIICANTGIYSRTINGGTTWDLFTTSPGLQLIDVHFINDTLVIMITPNSGSYFYISYDAGVTFSTTGTFSCSGMTDLSFPSKCVGYISSLNGMVIKYEDLNPQCSQLDISSVSESPGLRIFPNPVTEQKIYLDEKFIGEQFEIYDLQGRLVQFGFLESTELQLYNLTGIYIIKIGVGNNMHSHRIVVN